MLIWAWQTQFKAFQGRWVAPLVLGPTFQPSVEFWIQLSSFSKLSQHSDQPRCNTWHSDKNPPHSFQPSNSLSHFTLVSLSKGNKEVGSTSRFHTFKEYICWWNSLYFWGTSIQIQRFCNGLVLCSNGDMNMYFICNSQTMQWAKLPSLYYPRYSNYILVGFICDYYYDKVRVQFGSTTWCKVVLISEMGYNNVFNVKLFSSESGLWCEEFVSCQHDFIFH